MSDPSVDDGKITIPVSAETTHLSERIRNMTDPIDLPPNVASQFMASTVAGANDSSSNARNVANIAMGVLQAAAARNFDELGVTESRATSGVIATPIAGPTTQAGS